MHAARRLAETFPSVPYSELGKHRREAIEHLVAQALERGLRGPALRVWTFRIRAQLGNDLALEVALRLADREPA